MHAGLLDYISSNSIREKKRPPVVEPFRPIQNKKGKFAFYPKTYRYSLYARHIRLFSCVQFVNEKKQKNGETFDWHLIHFYFVNIFRFIDIKIKRVIPIPTHKQNTKLIDLTIKVLILGKIKVCAERLVYTKSISVAEGKAWTGRWNRFNNDTSRSFFLANIKLEHAMRLAIITVGVGLDIICISQGLDNSMKTTMWEGEKKWFF